MAGLPVPTLFYLCPLLIFHLNAILIYLVSPNPFREHRKTLKEFSLFVNFEFDSYVMAPIVNPIVKAKYFFTIGISFESFHF